MSQYTNNPTNHLTDVLLTIGHVILSIVFYGGFISFILLALASGVLNVKTALHYGECGAWLFHGIFALLSFGVAVSCIICIIELIRDRKRLQTTGRSKDAHDDKS